MAEPLDILDERDPLGFPFVGSFFVHAGIAALVFFGWYWMNQRHETLGDLNPGGGPAYAVSPVHSIPIPRRDAPPNPVANDTQSMVPTPAAKQEAEKKLPIPDKYAVEIPDRLKRQAPKPQKQQWYEQPTPPNQIYTRNPQAVSNPMYAAQTGGGQVGVGPNTPLGDSHLGAYAELIRQRIAQNWNTNGLDARSQSAPAVVSFTIMRDGTMRNPQIVQSSGNPSIDNTALRAVYSSNQLPGLPPQISENSITAQFTFNLHDLTYMMRFLICSLLILCSNGWLAAQQISGNIEKNPGKPHVAVPDFRASGAAASLITAFNSTVADDLQGSPFINFVPKTLYPLQIPQQPSDLVARCGPAQPRRRDRPRQPALGLESAADNRKLPRYRLWRGRSWNAGGLWLVLQHSPEYGDVAAGAGVRESLYGLARPGGCNRCRPPLCG